MTAVYPAPASIMQSVVYSDPWILRTTKQWDGAPGQKTEHAQRTIVTVSGQVHRGSVQDLDIFVSQLQGGINFAVLWDAEMRRQNDWRNAIADYGDDEVFREDGRMDLYAGMGGGVWRSVLVSASGSAGATTVSATGLGSTETVKKGTWLRSGDYRYRVAEDVTATGGAASVVIGSPLVTAVDTNVRLPGDQMVAQLVGRPDIRAADINGVRSYTLTFAEVYEDEADASGFEYP